MQCTACGIPAVVGPYEVTNPGVAKVPLSRRSERSEFGDGGGRELARYKHATAPFYITCCTPSIVLPPCGAAGECGDSSGAGNGSGILWTVIDEKKVCSRCGLSLRRYS